MHRGYIKLWRKFKDGELWKERRELSKWEAWIDILTEANHQQKQVLIGNRIIKCERGQCIKSLETWMKQWNWKSKYKVRTFLNLLETLKKITLKNETVTTRITVCNYDKYQNNENEIKTQGKRKENARKTQGKPNNNDKNEKNEKNNIYNPLSEKMKMKISTITPSAKITEYTIKRWNRVFRLMVERDNRTVNEIENMIDAVYKDSFWLDKILCAEKLRLRWNEGKLDRLIGKLHKPHITPKVAL